MTSSLIESPLLSPLHSFDQEYAQPKEQTKKIPRPLNSFMIFRLQSQKEIVRQCPGANHRDISKIISKWWKELSPTEKQSYKDQADRLKVEHRLMYPDYKFSPRKRTTKTRAYRKRAGNEFSARDYENKQSLYALYQSKPLTSQQDTRHSITYLVEQSTASCFRGPATKQESLASSPYLSTSPSDRSATNTPYDTQLLYPSATSHYASPASSVCPPVFSQNCSPATSYEMNGSTLPETAQGETLVNYNIYNSYYDSNAIYSTYHPLNGESPSTLPCYISLLPPPLSFSSSLSSSASSTHFSRIVRTGSPGNISYYTLEVSEGPQAPTPPNLLTQPFFYGI